ncbi:MAG: serine/threonine-protein kinase, partial [Candidatus Wallbacteria bacterium]|nr:serine/threonine-protein kinase [Candidatus Wallbacteria bacterium]
QKYFSGEKAVKFKDITLIGPGETGYVFRALDSYRNDFFAIKVLVEKHRVDRIRLHGLIHTMGSGLRTLDHPNIARVIDMVESEYPFFVFEYIDGESMRSIFERKGALKPPQAKMIALQICKALSFAHSKGIVHQDLRPENILIAQNQVKVTDFCMTRIRSAEFSPQNGDLACEFRYMAPELLAGEKPSPAMDIYSLGMTLYELTTGVHPFQNDDPALSRGMIPSTVPAKPSLICSDYPQDLENIIMKSLEKDPRKRHQSVNDMITELEALTLINFPEI